MPLVFTLAVVTATVACASVTRPVAVPGAGEFTVPQGAVNALQARWGRVVLGASPSAPCPGAAGTPAVAVRGDFNGDGIDDVVMWVTAGEASRLVALSARLNGEYTVVEVGDAETLGPSTVEVARRGTSYQLAALTIDSYFGVDTVITRACDGIRTAWFWTGETFQGQALAR